MNVSAISTAVAGFTSATNRLNQAAQNIASSNDDSQQQDQDTVQIGGITQTQAVNNDPAKNLINAQIASYDAQGDLNVIKVQDKLFKSLLNIVS